MRFFTVSIISALAALASAATAPDTSKPPSGNPISQPGLNEIVPAGEPYTITWDPTTPGKVSILLLRGPSTNVVPIATLADAIPNSGQFKWTPAASLEPDVSHYGIEIVVEGTGQYQYSTQFGIKNDEHLEHTTTEDVYPTEVPTYPTDEPTYPTEPTPTDEPTYPTDEPTYPTEPEPTYPTEPTEPTYPTYTWITVSVPTYPPLPTSSVSATPTPPATYTPSPTGAEPPVFTGAAGRNTAASYGGAAVAGLVALLAM